MRIDIPKDKVLPAARREDRAKYTSPVSSIRGLRANLSMSFWEGQRRSNKRNHTPVTELAFNSASLLLPLTPSQTPSPFPPGKIPGSEQWGDQ